MKKRYRRSSRTQNQLEAQRSGFELERRSKGAERSFKAAPKRDRLETEWSGFRSDVRYDPITNTIQFFLQVGAQRGSNFLGRVQRAKIR